jgi:Glycosyl hydrolases family 38 C-terminal domain
MMVGAN